MLTLTGPARPASEGAKFVFFAHRVADLKDEERRFSLSADDIALLNPTTHTCPVFRSRLDAELTKKIYRAAPPFIVNNVSSWSIKLGTQFHSSNDAHRFEEFSFLISQGWQLRRDGILANGESRAYRLYEGKMFTIYDHRAATVEFSQSAIVRQRQSREISLNEHKDPSTIAIPFFSVRDEYFSDTVLFPWIICFKKVTASTNERTLISSLLPTCSTNDSIHLLIPTQEADAPLHSCLLAEISSFALDFIGRQKLGGVNFNFYIFEQLPIHPPENYTQICSWKQNSTIKNWLLPRVLELTYAAWDLQPFARDCGYLGPPFRWDAERRFLLRCELDAAYFHLYGLERDDVDYIMETFPIVKRRDEEAHGEYRTKRVILEIYDEMAEAIRTGQPYQTRLDPPPADPRVAHPWDPAYGELPEPGKEWMDVTADGGPATADEITTPAVIAEEGEGYTVKETPVRQSPDEAEPLVLSHPEPEVKKSKKPKPAQVAQETFLEVMSAPTGPRAARLKRAMALGQDHSPVATRELVAFLADEDENIRWLAGSSLVRRAGADTVAAIAAFLTQAEPERVERARSEALRVLSLIADTAEEEAVRQAAKALIAGNEAS